MKRIKINFIQHFILNEFFFHNYDCKDLILYKNKIKQFIKKKGNNIMIDQMNEKVIKSIIENIPIEITVIDTNDEVIGWNKHENRLFKRPYTSMGSNFRDCHPKESLDKVEKIVKEMKEGKRDVARFWIDMGVKENEKKHKILIEFYALRDEEGKYLGCMECTQDVEGMRNLQGEKRLLD